MPHCKSCAAPLPAYSSRCDYCGSKNDIDLKGIQEYTISQVESERKCPVCEKPMESITLKELPKFTIERCSGCMGLFFDPEELNALLDASVNQVYSVNLHKMWEMNQMSGREEERKTAYVKCPVCSSLMNRVNFGARSGVVIDKCTHGIWLDGGELRKLLEWRKAGGQLYHETVIAEKLKQEELLKNKKTILYNDQHPFIFTSKTGSDKATSCGSDVFKIVETAANVIWWLFK